MDHVRWKAVKGIFAVCMLLCGMLIAYEPAVKQYESGQSILSGSGEQAVLTQAVPADERKEEKTSTTSQLYAQSAVLMDADNGRILLGKNEEQILPMASTTKIMTCILVLEEGNCEDIIPVSSYAAGQPKVHMGAKRGEYYRVGDLLYSLMLESHNDAAVILAEYYGSLWGNLSLDCASHSLQESQKAVTIFADKMNQKAKNLGCENTFFVTPNGLDGVLTVVENGRKTEKQHVTTAADLAGIMKYCAWDSPASAEFLSITRTETHVFQNRKKAEGGNVFETGSHTISCRNHNAFLQMMDGALTGKTGFTGKAGYCYVGALEKDGKKFTIALLACGWPNNKTWKWHDSKLLFAHGLENYEWRNIYKEEEVQTVSVEDGQDDVVRIKNINEELSMLLGQHDAVEIMLHIPEKLDAPVKKGERVGAQDYYVNGEKIYSVPVVAVNEVLKIDFDFCLRNIIKVFLL